MTVTQRANARAQRRFHRAIVRGVVRDGDAPETRLWIEAEQLVTRLRSWARMTEAQLDAAHEAAMHAMSELAEADVPLAETEARMLWGDR